jgi:hypothetical protein
MANPQSTTVTDTRHNGASLAGHDSTG